MRALFANDHRFIPADGKIYSECQFDSELWCRYLSHFSYLTVAGRLEPQDRGIELKTCVVSSRECVAFELLPDLCTLKGMTLIRQGVLKRMRKVVAGSDAVIARLPSEIGFLAIAAARMEHRPWAVEVAGCPWDGLWNYGSVKAKLYAPIAFLRMRNAVGKTRHVIYVTSEFLQRRYPSTASNKSWASNVALEYPSKSVLRERLDRIQNNCLLRRPVIFGLIGTLRGRFKGIQTLFAALSMLGQRAHPFEVRILGSGDPSPWIKEAERHGIRELVTFDGTLPTGLPVLKWLDNVDIYVQPSLKEGLPRALIEAMSRGCPAVASSAAGIPELLESEVLFTPGDSAGLARILRARVDDIGWMKDRAQKNWLRACDYSSEVLDARRNAFWERFAKVAREESVRRVPAPFGSTKTG